MIAILLSAFLLGLAGSFHCAGMCGPIVVALPLQGNTLLRKIYGGLLYNAGRIITYGVMGAMFGLIGQGLHLVGFQQIVSVIMGAFMVVLALFPGGFQRLNGNSKYTNRLFVQIKYGLHRFLSVHTFRSLFFIGFLNGLLPCGLVYIAIAGAVAAGSAALGTSYMLLFGLGTIPMLLFIAVLGNIISVSLRHKINKLIPILVVIVGILFILRGLNLGIPYLSPTKEKIEKKFEKSIEEKNLNISASVYFLL